MIVTFGEIMEEMYEEFDEIEKSSLNKIVLKGLSDMKNELSKGEEFYFTGDRDIHGGIKFYRPLSRNDYGKYIIKRDSKREANGKKNKSK